jgi:hypothetical protein
MCTDGAAGVPLLRARIAVLLERAHATPTLSARVNGDSVTAASAAVFGDTSTTAALALASAVSPVDVRDAAEATRAVDVFKLIDSSGGARACVCRALLTV